MREVEKINFNQYLEGFDKSKTHGNINPDDYLLFEFDDTEKLICNDTFDTTKKSDEQTEKFDDGSKVTRTYSYAEEDYNGNPIYNVSVTLTDNDGNKQYYTGKETFDETGKSTYSVLSSKNNDGTETKITKSYTTEIEVTSDNKTESIAFNNEGELVEYNGETLVIDFDKDAKNGVKYYTLFDSDGKITERYVDSSSSANKRSFIQYTDKDGNKTTYSTYKKENSSKIGEIEQENSDGSRTLTIFNSLNEKNAIIIENYDENNNLISEESKIDLDKDGTVDSYSKTIYDENGNKIAEANSIDYDKDGRIDEYSNVTYDKDGNITTQEFEYSATGKISENTNQGNYSNCQLFAGLDALSYTSKGQEIIKNSLTQNEDGSYSVYFKGLDESYTVTNKDIHKAKKENKGSSKDITQLIYVIGFEKALEKIRDNKTDYSIYENFLTNWHKNRNATEVGDLNQTSYMMFGQKSIINLGPFSKRSVLKKLQKDPEDYIATANFVALGKKSICKLTDINGEEHPVAGGPMGFHECAIKKVTDDTVTIVNPWKGAEEIVVDKKEFLKNVDFIEYANLNEEKANKAGEKFKKFISRIPYDLANVFRVALNGKVHM